MSARLIYKGEKLLDYKWQHVPATAYLAFERTGDRKEMESIQGANRSALISLMMAELAEGKGRFLDQLANGLWFASQETSWVLSAHQHRQPSGRSLPDERFHLIDLGSGRIGAVMAIAWHFFHEAIDKIDPSICEAALQALKRQILDPYLDKNAEEANWWLGFDESKMVNNWNPWCNSDVILTYLLIEKDPARLREALGRSARSVDRLLAYITEDGACEEGPSYWDSAAGRVYDYLQILYDASHGAFDVFDNPRLRRMGEYISRCYVGNGYVVNFADASARSVPNPILIYQYGKATGSREMQDFAMYLLADRKKGCFRSPGIMDNEGNRALTSLRCRKEMLRQVDSLNRTAEATSFEQVLGGLRKEVPASTWYPETEFAFLRNDAGWFLGAKGGFNNESHNHNDVGTFVLYIRDIPVFVDAGVGTYTKDTFGKKRYTIWTMQCDWHNLPMPNGVAQPHGKKYRSANATCDVSNGRFSLDIQGAYPDSASCRSWRREYSLSQKGSPSLKITDKYSLSRRLAPDVQHFLVKARVIQPGESYKGRSLKKGELLLLCDEGLVVRMSYPKNLTLSVEEKPLDDPRLSSVWGPSLRRISLVSPAGAAGKGCYSFTVQEY